MSFRTDSGCIIYSFPPSNKNIDEKENKKNKRKSGINEKKTGSVRLIKGRVVLDFRYLGERCREPYGIPPKNDNGAFIENARNYLDNVVAAIKNNTLYYAENFPNSKKKEEITRKENKKFKRFPKPNEIKLIEFIPIWSKMRFHHLTERTINEYNSYLRQYIKPFFGERSFAEFDLELLSDFYSWAKDLKLRGRTVSNKSLNKYIDVLRQIAKHARIKYKWQNFKAFFGYEKLPESDPFYLIDPFDTSEQKKILTGLKKSFWLPYVDFAFASGISPGEQQALFCKHINLDNSSCSGRVEIEQSVTIDINGKIIIGRTKNKYRKRTLIMNKRILTAVKAQYELHRRKNINSDYFFCMPDGRMFDSGWFAKNVWRPLLEKLEINYRPIRQARHSFTTNHMRMGKNALAIAKFLGHRDAEMVIKVYAKWKQKVKGINVGEDEIVNLYSYDENEPLLVI